MSRGSKVIGEESDMWFHDHGQGPHPENPMRNLTDKRLRLEKNLENLASLF